MAVLRPCSASLCFTLTFESSSSLGSFSIERPSRRTRRVLIGASSVGGIKDLRGAAARPPADAPVRA